MDDKYKRFKSGRSKHNALIANAMAVAAPGTIKSMGKAKLPNGWSFPVGLEFLSEHLAGTGIDPPLTLFFKQGTMTFAEFFTWPKRSGMKAVDGPGPRLVLSVCHSRTRGDRDARGSWDMTVFAVPGTLRRRIADLLGEGGMEPVRSWLQTKRPETWYEGYKEFVVFYDEAEDGLRYEDRNR